MKKLFIRPLGGLANRLMGVISAIRVAEYYDREPIVIWKTESNCFAKWQDLFELDICDPNPVIRNTENIRIDSGTLRSGVKPVLNLSNLEQDFYVATNCFIGHEQDDRGDGFWNFSKAVVDTSRYLEKLNILSDLKSRFEQFRSDVDFSGRIGLHIRRGFQDKEAAVAGFKRINFEHYDIVLQKYIDQSSFSCFIASDDPDAIDFFKQKYGIQCISYPTRSYSKNDSPEAIQDALIDILLLSETSRLIGVQGSSFAYFASLIHLRPYTAIVSEIVEESEHRAEFNESRIKFVEHSYSFEESQFNYVRNYDSCVITSEVIGKAIPITANSNLTQAEAAPIQSIDTMCSGNSMTSQTNQIKGESEYQLLLSWVLKNCPSPPPHFVKVETIKRYIEAFNIEVFIETGVGAGATLNEIAKLGIRCISIELDTRNYNQACQLLRSFENVTIIQGDSAIVLPKILESLDQPALFWLDAHYSYDGKERAEKETPINEELFAILNHTITNHVILIDDVRLFGNPRGDRYKDYPSIKQVLENVQASGRKIIAENYHDILRLTPKV